MPAARSERLENWMGAFLSVLLGAIAYSTIPAEAQKMNETITNDLQCEIQQRKRGDAIDFLGIVWSDHKTTGSYGFIVNKTGPAGISSVTQKGVFTTDPDEEKIIGTVTLNAREGDHFFVRLTVTDDDTGYSCSVTRE